MCANPATRYLQRKEWIDALHSTCACFSLGTDHCHTATGFQPANLKKIDAPPYEVFGCVAARRWCHVVSRVMEAFQGGTCEGVPLFCLFTFSLPSVSSTGQGVTPTLFFPLHRYFLSSNGLPKTKTRVELYPEGYVLWLADVAMKPGKCRFEAIGNSDFNPPYVCDLGQTASWVFLWRAMAQEMHNLPPSIPGRGRWLKKLPSVERRVNKIHLI